MDTYPPYMRSVCLAKRAELARDLVAALRHLADALRLTREPGDVLQLERWQARLEDQRMPLLRPPKQTTSTKPLPGQKEFLPHIIPRKRSRPKKTVSNPTPEESCK